MKPSSAYDGKQARSDVQSANIVKDRLKNNFDLPFELAIYVPSTKEKNEPISEKEFQSRINEVSEYLSKLFGGYSSSDVNGGYVDSTKGLIKETAFRVVSFAPKKGFNTKMSRIIKKIKEWCKEWSQDSIGLEFEGDMYYLSEKAKYKDGGVMCEDEGYINIREGLYSSNFVYQIGGL